MKTNWHARFLNLARHVATWSKDPSTKVGAVIVDDLHRVVSMGFNGFPRGIRDTDERLNDRPTKYKLVVHAEANAILNAPQPVRGCALYVTFDPCSDCAKLILQSGIRTVYVAPRFVDSGARWTESQQEAREMLLEGGVEVFGVAE